MAIVINAQDIQTWLDGTKLTVATVEIGLEEVAKTEIFSAVALQYVTTGWIDESTTPLLIRQLIGMQVAAWLYRRAYSETELASPNYADILEQHIASIIAGIIMGTIDLIDVPGVVGVAGGPTYWPDETTGSSQQFDARGVIVGDQYAEDIKFRMGMKF